MKRNFNAWLFFILNIICILILPCVFVWLQYGDLEYGYKISVTAIILTIVIVLIFKKIIVNKFLKSLDAKIINIETSALSITDAESIKASKNTWRFCSIIKLIIDSIIPICICIMAVLTIKAVEQGIIKLYGCLIFSLISIGIGIIFKIAEIITTKLYHE